MNIEKSPGEERDTEKRKEVPPHTPVEEGNKEVSHGLDKNENENRDTKKSEEGPTPPPVEKGGEEDPDLNDKMPHLTYTIQKEIIDKSL